MNIKKSFFKISKLPQEKIKKLLFIILVFSAGAVAGTEIDTIFSNEPFTYAELKKISINISKDPFFILITGGGITSLLIPKLTNKIQDRKENFEIKQQLMENINTSTTRLLEKTKMLSVGTAAKEDLHTEFLNWRESCAVIGTTVRAYWSAGKEKNVVVKEWNEYYENVENLYNVIINYKKKEEYECISKEVISFLKKNDSDFDLEYEDNDVEKFTNAFFNEAKKHDASKKYSENYSRALYDLVRLFDKRKYYLLKLVFKNKIKNH